MSTPVISIQIISRGEESLDTVLDSIDRESEVVKSMGGVEIVVVASGVSGDCSNRNLPHVRSMQTVNLPLVVGHMRARFEAFKRSSGSFSFILDSTRPVLPRGLELLAESTNEADLVVAREESIGDSYWARLARLDKHVTGSALSIKTAIERTDGAVLPRLIRSDILKEAFANLRLKLGDETFNQVKYGEHHLIAAECYSLSHRVRVTPRAVISHFEDNSLRAIVSKYYRYGRSQRILSQDKVAKVYPTVASLASHRRVWSGVPLGTRISLQPLYIIRSASFLAGFVVGS